MTATPDIAEVYEVPFDTHDKTPESDLRGLLRYWIGSRNFWARSFHQERANSERKCAAAVATRDAYILELIHGTARSVAVTRAHLAAIDSLRIAGEDDLADTMHDSLVRDLDTLHASLIVALDQYDDSAGPTAEELIARIEDSV